jgi:hypothetical protein
MTKEERENRDPRLLEWAETELKQSGCFSINQNPWAVKLVECLDDNVPFDMAFAIANFTMASLAGHFQTKMELADDNHAPTNFIGFILAKSGAKKTSSVRNMDKAIKPALDLINVKRDRKAEAIAKELDTTKKRLMPLKNALGTAPGLLQNLNFFKEEGIGCPTLVVDEVANALAINKDFPENVEVIAQLFDDGDCDVKVIKDQEMQLEPVYGMGMNGLFIGSEKGILQDPVVLKKFEFEFISKLARRCFFIYPVFEEDSIADISDYKEYRFRKKESKEKKSKAQHEVKERSAKIAGNLMDRDLVRLKVADEVFDVWECYQDYCSEKAKLVHEDLEATMLEQEHRHWKVMKLAGVYAFWRMSDTIELVDFQQAVYAGELTSGHLTKFVDKAQREPYELMLEHFLQGGETLSVHDMIKKGWIRKKNNIPDLISNANSKLAGKGNVEMVMDLVKYQEFNFLEKDCMFPISFKQLPPMEVEKRLEELKASMNDEEIIRTGYSLAIPGYADIPDEAKPYHVAKKMEKDKRSNLIHDGYVVKETSWDKLANVLSNDMAYCPFQFMTPAEGAIYSKKLFPNEPPHGGYRGKDNIKSKARFVVLDIDDSDVSIHEVADMLDDYRYHMALSSDPHNIYKFRVILQSDIDIDLPGTKWKQLIQIIAMHFDLVVDNLPKSQIFYGFADREVKSNDGKLLEVSTLIKELPQDVKQVAPVSLEARSAIWEDRQTEFRYAYSAVSGGGFHLALFKAMRHAADLGFSYTQNMELIEDIIMVNGTTPRRGFMPSLESQAKERYGIEDDKY